jgi:tetratricopeptide (TPR) repeat protein
MLRGLYRRSNSASSQLPPDASFHAALDSHQAANTPNEDVERVRVLLSEQRSAEAVALVPEIVCRQKSVPALRRVGDALLAAGHAQAAMQAFVGALALQPDDVSSLLGQAKSARLLGWIEDAVDSLEIALAHDPRSMDAVLELADLYQGAEAWREAASLLERALNIEPARSDLWLRMAAVRIGCEQFGAAIMAGERALAIDPTSPTALSIVGMMHLERLDDPRRAETYFRKALAIDASCHAARANLGLALQEQGDFDAALAHYEDARSGMSGISLESGACISAAGQFRGRLGGLRIAIRSQRRTVASQLSIPALER